MNIGVAIVSTRKCKLASFSRSVLIFGVSSARFVALMNIENPCYSRRSSKTKRLRGGGLGPPPTKRPVGFRPLQQLRSCGRWNWQPHRFLPEEFRQSPSPRPSPHRPKFRGCSFPRFLPQTNAKCFFSSRCDKCDFVPESFLFSKQGKDFPFQSLGELGNAALQMHGDFACKHVNLL